MNCYEVFHQATNEPGLTKSVPLVGWEIQGAPEKKASGAKHRWWQSKDGIPSIVCSSLEKLKNLNTSIFETRWDVRLDLFRKSKSDYVRKVECLAFEHTHFTVKLTQIITQPIRLGIFKLHRPLRDKTHPTFRTLFHAKKCHLINNVSLELPNFNNI